MSLCPTSSNIIYNEYNTHARNSCITGLHIIQPTGWKPPGKERKEKERKGKKRKEKKRKEKTYSMGFVQIRTKQTGVVITWPATMAWGPHFNPLTSNDL
jgi:hypothetical protein